MSNYRNIDVQQLADIFRALSNPNRLRIFLELLDCCGPGMTCATDGDAKTCVGEIGRNLSIVPSTISHHIKELKLAGLIQLERQGRRIELTIDVATVNLLAEFFLNTEVTPLTDT